MNFKFEQLTLNQLPFFIETRNSSRFFLHNSNFFTLSEAEAWIQNSKSCEYWMINLDSIYLGYFRLKNVSDEEVEIGADFHPSARGKGYAKNAYKSFVIQLIQTRGYKYCSLRVLRSNIRAFKLYKDLGFETVEETELDYKMVAEINKILS